MSLFTLTPFLGFRRSLTIPSCETGGTVLANSMSTFMKRSSAPAFKLQSGAIVCSKGSLDTLFRFLQDFSYQLCPFPNPVYLRLLLDNWFGSGGDTEKAQSWQNSWWSGTEISVVLIWDNYIYNSLWYYSFGYFRTSYENLYFSLLLIVSLCTLRSHLLSENSFLLRKCTLHFHTNIFSGKKITMQDPKLHFQAFLPKPHQSKDISARWSE